MIQPSDADRPARARRGGGLPGHLSPPGVTPQELNFDRFFSIQDLLAYQGEYFGLGPTRPSCWIATA
jgi:hypothetical protein